MSIGIQDLSDELVVRLTRVLARRPEYGIARPSRRWLVRQQEMIEHLPKELLRSTNMFKRLAHKLIDRIDPTIIDPQAVLCGVHSSLNPFLIRRLFMALAYEVTVHTDPLRSWPGRLSTPELSALVGRLDSITALWTEPHTFREIYGAAPFDNHHIFVMSGCEACCIAAVGASGRALADLRAALIDRRERRGMKSGKEHEPRLYRIVEAWIDHLRKKGEEVSRAEQCRNLSEDLLVQLRIVRSQVNAWRHQQKKTCARLEASQRPVYTELRRSNSGTKITPLPSRTSRHRRTRDGIPVAMANSAGADAEIAAAMSSGRRVSIYRPDSLSGYSQFQPRSKPAHDVGADGRPYAPEPDRASGPSHDSPTDSFLYRFEHELPLANEEARDDESEDGRELDEKGFEEEERSRIRVQEWYSSRLAESHVGPVHDGEPPVMARVHPAFLPNEDYKYTSAVPDPLHIHKTRSETASGPDSRPLSAASEWTNCTVYTVESDSDSSPDAGDGPPVPDIPSDFERNEEPLTERNDSKKKDAKRTTWPAPPEGPSPANSNRSNLGRGSDVGSQFSSHFSSERQRFLRERFKVKEPFNVSTKPGVKYSGSGKVPSNGSTANDPEPAGKERRVPRPASVEDEVDTGEAWGLRNDGLEPDDSASNVRWRRKSFSSVTQLGGFGGQM